MAANPYEILDKAAVADMLKSFQACTCLPVQLLDGDGAILEAYGPATGYCLLLKKHLFSQPSCEKIHMDAARRAQSLGETYIFNCHAGLTHMVFPLLRGGVLYGAVLAGPFLMDAPDSGLVLEISKGRTLSAPALLGLYEELSAVKQISPALAGHMSRLLFYLFSGATPDAQRELLQRHEQLAQQARINESIQRFKSQGVTEESPYPYELERELLVKVRTGDLYGASALLNELLGFLQFSSGGQLEPLRNRALELCSLFSRVAVDQGAPADSALRLNDHVLSSLRGAQTLEGLGYQLLKALETFMESGSGLPASAGRESIKKAVRYISRNYALSISLEDVSRYVNLSPSYFSGLFKQCTGFSFKEYLNLVRIEESKRLLANTDYSIVDIAVATGFQDQSYFSKVFKRHVGVTPKQYR